MIATIPQSAPLTLIQARRDEYLAAIERVLDSGRYILGPEVDAFEAEFADAVDVSHAVGVANGTDAIEIALRALGIGPGSPVYSVAHTAGATTAAILRSGAVPILVDVDEQTSTMDPASLESAIASGAGTEPGRTRPGAVVPVHLYGAMADMPAILAIARRSGLQVVEDAAQAHGAAIDGRQAGTWGDAAAFSFYPTKNLGAIGDGGAVTTSDPELAATMRELREYGWRTRQYSERLGVNSRLDELQASILRVGLRYLEVDDAARVDIARRYDVGLADSALRTPGSRRGYRHVYHQYVVRVAERASFQAWCAERGVGTAIHYPTPVHRQPAYRDRVVLADALTVTDRLAAEVVSLPMSPGLGADDVARVIAVAADWRPQGAA